MKICKIRKISIIIVSFILVAVFAVTYFLSISKSKIALANSSVDIKGDFACDSVTVILDSEISEINKLHSKQFFKGVNIDSVEDLTKRSVNFVKGKNFRQILRLNIKNGTKEKIINAIDVLSKIPGIYSVEPHYIIKPASVTTDDTYFRSNTQWNLNGTGGIDIQNAWSLCTGSKSVRVGIIDSGIANHEDLNNNLVAGYDYYNDNSVTNDDYAYHGTYVAGIIGAETNNGRGIAGINWNVQLVPMQCSYYYDDVNDTKPGQYVFDTNAVIEAISKATDLWYTNDRIDILNYSVFGFGDINYLSILLAILEYPGLFVWSAGNEGKNVDKFSFIDKFNADNLISVGASNKYNERSIWNSDSSSNFGNAVNIYAPGGSGNTNLLNITSTSGDGKYYYFNGTSAAAPHVAGVAALILAKVPHLSASQLKTLILDNSDSITITVPTDSGGTTTQQVKKLNAYKAVNAANTKHKMSYEYYNRNQHWVNCDSCDYCTVEAHELVPYPLKRNVFDINAIKDARMCTKCNIIIYSDGTIGGILMKDEDKIK